MFKVGAKAVTTPERPPQQPSGDSETPPDPGCSGSLKMKFKKFKDKKSKKRKHHRENDNSPPNSQRTEEHRKEPEKKKRRISKPKNKALDSIPRQNEVERSKTNERQSSGTLDNVLDSVKGQEEPSRKQLENDNSGNESQRNADAFQASARPMVNIHDMDLGNDTIKKEPIGNLQLFNSFHDSFVH